MASHARRHVIVPLCAKTQKAVPENCCVLLALGSLVFTAHERLAHLKDWAIRGQIIATWLRTRLI